MNEVNILKNLVIFISAKYFKFKINECYFIFEYVGSSKHSKNFRIL